MNCKDLELMQNTMQDVKNTYEYNVKRHSELDKMLNDYNHELEFSNYDVVRGFKLYKKIHSTLNERRKVKNEIEILHSTYKVIKNNQSLLNNLSTSLAEAKQIEKRLTVSVYHKRTAEGKVAEQLSRKKRLEMV